jgi:hypothetical protein
MMRPSVARDWFIGGRTYRRNDDGAGTTGELHRAHTDSTRATLHQNGAALYRTCDVNTAMRSDSGNTEARSLLERDSLGQPDRLRRGHYGVLGGCAERTI